MAVLGEVTAFHSYLYGDGPRNCTPNPLDARSASVVNSSVPFIQEIEMGAKPLSRRLSSQAKKLAMRATTNVVTGLAEISPVVGFEKLEQEVERLGGTVRRTADDHLITYSIAAEHLSELADLDGVVHVSSAEPYRPASKSD